MDDKPTPPGRTAKRQARRKFLKRLGGAAGIGTGGTLAWAALIEPFYPVVERKTVTVPRLPPAFDGVRVALLSDLHLQPGFSADRLKPALAHLSREKPDLILLLGDYVDGRLEQKEKYIARCAEAFSQTRAPLGVFAGFGNHDYPPPPADPDPGPWRAAGVTPLNDEIAEITRGDSRIFLVGLRSFIMRPVTPADTLRRLPPNECRVVLWHEPDRAPQAADAGGCLQVSGHTHGGQVRLPFIGPPLLPPGGRRYPSGLYRVAQMSLYVTRGVGLLPPRVRFNCPPEVTILTLRSRA